MAQNPTEPNVLERFVTFFQGRLVRQQSFLEQLHHSISSESANEVNQQKSLIVQVLAHYQEYYEEKAKLARQDVFLLFCPPWLSSFERTLLWAAGDLSGNKPRGNKQSLMQQGRSRKLEQPNICMSHQGIPSPFGEQVNQLKGQEPLFQSKDDLHNHTRKEMALSGNERGDNRLPTFNQRRLQSEVRVPGGREEREVQRSRGRTEGRQRSHSREPSFLGEARKKRRIEELEEELKLLKEGDKNKDEQRRSRQSRSQSGSCGSPHPAPSHKERSRGSDYRHRRKVSPKKRRHRRSKTPQQEQNPIWRKLQQISHSHFSTRIERAKFPAKFVTPPFAVYDGKSDPVGHLSRFRQAMAIHNSNDALMCRVFPSSLGEVGLRWFDRLEHGSIRSWKEMSKIFTARFITNTRKPKEIDSLLALTMKVGETLKSYSTRYWEVYNDIDACDEDIVVKTFRFGLHEDSKLRKSFTKRPPINMAELMTRLEQHIRVEDDPKSAAKIAEVAPLVDRKAAQPEPQPESRRAKKAKNSTGTSGTGVCLAVYTTFKEPIYRLLPFIKDKPYFEWPPKMPGDPATRETKPYCNYHREREHLTEHCRAYRYHLEHLVKNGHLKQYVDESKSPHQNVEVPRINVKASAPVGIIDVIHFESTCHDQRGEMRRAAHLREVFQVQDSPQMAPGPLRKESVEEIVFNNQDLEGVQLPHSDALVITLRIGEFDVKRVLIDPGSSVEIMYESLFRGLGLRKKDLSGAEGPLSGFSGETVIPSGKVMINVRAGTVSSPTEFFVLNTFSPYNAILGRPWLHRMGAVPSTLHQRLRFPTPQDIMEIMGDQLAAKQCLVAAVKQRDQRPQGEHRTQLLTLLDKYQDVFAWTPYEAPGVNLEFVCHELNVSPEYKPVIQKARRTAPQHAEAVREEVARLLKIEAIREVLYPQWLSNTVIVKKKNRKWRVCVDFTDLNKACPKDPFPLPKIDQLVDSTAGHERMSFLDAFQGYHQIALRSEDQEKTAFITPRGVFCYKVMPFGLKNAGATYQRMVTKMFSELLGKTVEVYIDDMVVKSVKGTDHMEDLEQVFGILRRHNLKLNASKCAFGVGSGKFLGFLVTQRGIEANPDQIAAIQGLQPPKNVREVQRLTGMAAALNRFISKSAEKCQPFFDLIKKGKSFAWSEESDHAFEQLKKYLSAPPLLSSPKEGEPLYIYLAVSDKAVSAAIIRDDSGEQRPVYYTSKTMNGAKTRYLPLEKSALALFALFRSSDFSGRISKWGAQLGAYNVRYKPRTAIKGQVLADFIAEFAPGNSILTGGEHPKDTERDLEKKDWVFASNNEAEYETLLHGLRAAKRLGADPLTIHCDSQLIVNQLTGEYMAKDERMIAYLDLARNLLKGFYKFSIERVGREHNRHADSLAGLASSVAPDFRRTITVEVQDSPSIAKSGQASICQIEMGPSWMDPILDYLSKDILPADQKEAAKIRKTATRAIGQGYWWPYMQNNTAQYVRRCEKCQLFAPAIHRPASQLNPISSPWPFAQWGLDLVGPLPRATGNRQWLIVATDYFTNSTAGHSRSTAQISGSETTSPVRPTHRETDRRSHPIRTTPRSSTGETPYSLTYGVEAVIPLEVGLPTLRSEEYDRDNNELMLAKDLDLAQERRDLAMIRLASYQGDLKKRYGKSVSERILAPGDLVLRKVLGSRRDPAQGKLGANWEGPYQIVSEAGLGAFNLKGMDDKPLKRPWNISNLKKFYQ
uniref:RNase H type-1 domain-containing protein n=1 Tax=Fagus sylvatica TaxID=28930 RepID=A0A2N9GWW3_FAGSY